MASFMKSRAQIVILFALLLLQTSAGCEAKTLIPPTAVSMRNVVLYPYDDAPSRIAKLRGTIISTKAGHPAVFDDVGSYKIDVSQAEVHLSAATITILMNRYIFPSANGPVTHVDVTFGTGTLQMKGAVVKAGLTIPFSATAIAQPNGAGDMTIRITDMTAAGLVSKKFMDFLGLRMSAIAQPTNTSVFRIIGDTMIIPVLSMFPPPKINGHIRSIHVTPTEMVAILGSPINDFPKDSAGDSYIKCRGGVLKFAKLTMQDVDLTLIPLKGAGSLGFSPANYYRQMQAGLALMLPNRGLVAKVPSYTDMLQLARPR
jgi:hypothetical protein